MNKNAITKSQLADQLGLSLRTFQRKLDQADLIVPRGLICLDTQDVIKLKLGYGTINKGSDQQGEKKVDE